MMNNKIPEAKWNPVDGMRLEENALLAIREENNVLVIAGPGAGKTELLAQKACYLLQTNKCPYPRKILAISFKKDAAENLKDRVEKRCGKELAGRFISMTYDAFAKSLLDRFRRGLPEEYQPDINYIIAEDKDIQLAFETFGITNKKTLANLKDRLTAVKLPIEPNHQSLNLVEEAWKLLLKGNGTNISSCLTFQMISRLAEYLIRTNIYLKNALQLTYSHVFLDEFQDTTEIQYELVKTCFMGCDCNMTAVGDNKQRIMLWAGALKTVFNDFGIDFSAVDRPLLMNHRSAPNLVALQKMMYELLQDEPKKIICSEKWNGTYGNISLCKFKDYETEAEVIANDIEQKHRAGLKLNEICILTKQKPAEYTVNLIEELKQKKINARVETEYQDLLKEPITIIILHSLYLFSEKKKPNSWQVIMDYIKSAYKEQISNDYEFLLKKQIELKHILKGNKGDLDACDDISLFNEIVKDFLSYYNVDILKSIFPTYTQGAFFEKTVDKLLNLLWKAYEETENDWEKALENFEGLHSIPIMTIHKSKGLEYDTVYFIGLEDSAFWNFKNQPMEDRCAFFVALSRAKRNICFTFSNHRNVGFDSKQNYYFINEFYQLLENTEFVNVIEY